jgi:tetratricopeptide (TPR) repeat protein
MQAFHRGDYDEARALGESAVAMDREIGVRSHEAQKLLRLAQIAIAAGDFATARHRLREALTTDRDLESAAGEADDLDEVANMAADLGQHRQGAMFAGAADVLREATGSVVVPVDIARHARYRARSREVLGDVAFDAAFAVGRAKATGDAVTEALAFLEGGEATF